MILSDFHLHSNFSGDCDYPMEEMIQEAINRKIHYLCFTEHHDIDFPECGINYLLDLPSYTTHINKMKDIYKNDLQVLMGIEIGIQPHLYDQLNALIHDFPFDFILASNHLGQGMDPYEPSYFKDITKHEAYMIYFKDILFNVKYYDNYDIYGHLDYVIRYYPGNDKSYDYDAFKEVLDQILATLIEKKKGIEVNTSGLRKGIGTTNPIKSVLMNYYTLGGKIITLGSDAHKPEDLLADFEATIQMLKEIGFKGHYVYVKRKPIFIAFD